MNRRQVVLGVVVVVAVVARAASWASRSGGSAATTRTDASPSAITATGTGKVKAVPDVAEVDLGVSATAPTRAAPAPPQTRSSPACSRR